MNVEEYVLVVFLTSHGSEDASVSVDFPPLGLTDLRAADLRSMLDDAGKLLAGGLCVVVPDVEGKIWPSM